MLPIFKTRTVSAPAPATQEPVKAVAEPVQVTRQFEVKPQDVKPVNATSNPAFPVAREDVTNTYNSRVEPSVTTSPLVVDAVTIEVDAVADLIQVPTGDSSFFDAPVTVEPVRAAEVTPIRTLTLPVEEATSFESKVAVNKPIENILIELGVNASYVRNAVTRQKVTNRPLSEVARDTGLVSAEKIAEAISIQTGLPFFRAKDIDRISNMDVLKIKEIFNKISPDAEFKFNGYIPVGFSDGYLMVAVSSTNKASEAKNSFSNYKPKLVISSDKNIQTIYRKYFANTDLAFDAAVKAALKSLDDQSDENINSIQDLLGELLRHACFVGASDIYLFADDKEGTIKIKVGGRGRLFRYLRKDLYMRLAQVIVTITGKGEGLSLAPQDAKLELKDGLEIRYKDVAERYVFRLSMVKERGTGELKIVIRANDSQSSEADFDQLGFDVATTQAVKRHIMNPHGLVLISGPTGSGKTTSLYAILREINSLERQVLTMEKPIEYRNGSWIQYELKGDQEEGIEAREMLNAMLRQSPDVIFMGELRDNFELAKVCVTAANTGHLVFSTIHTNDGPSTLTRLLNLGISAVDIANVLRFVLSMRLVPLLCEHCKVPDDRAETKSHLNVDFLSKRQKRPHMASVGGCQHCEFTGVRGRKSVYEYMDGHDAGSLLVKGESVSSIRDKVYQRSDTMWGRGLVYVADGIASIDDLFIKVGKS